MAPFEPDRKETGDRRELFISLLFLGLAGLLMVFPPGTQERISAALRGSVLAPFIWVQESLHEARARAVDVSSLQVRMDSLAAVVSSQRNLLEENRRLRELLDLRERADPSWLAGTAIRPGTRGSESMFLLDVGSRSGVSVRDPVIGVQGLVGVVREVAPGSSLAMDWTHPDFRASVMTLDGETYGIVEPSHGAFREEDRLLLTGVSYHTPLTEGTAVVTSGLGSVYPRGILVGTVESVAETEAGWRRSYWVRPSVRPGSVTHVLVITGGRVAAEEGLEELWVDPGGGP